MHVEYEDAGTSAGEFDDLDVKQAVQFGDLSKVRHLIESGLASPNDTDVDECSLLHWAAINNRLQIAKYLISKNADINHIGGVLACTPLHWACRQGHTRMVALLVKNGADYTIRDGEGFTVLHTACQYGRTPIACYLIAKGQSPDTRDAAQLTPLMYAAMRTTTRDPMQMLVSMGANVNATDGIFGNTALHYAVMHGNHASIGTLLKLKADTSIPNKENETSYDIALRKNDFLAMQLIAMNERQRGLRRFTFKQTIYEDTTLRSFVAQIIPFLFYFLPGFVIVSSYHVLIKMLLVAAIYAALGSLLSRYIGHQYYAIGSFALFFVITSKMYFFVIWLMYLHQSAGWYLQISFFVVLVMLPYLHYLLCVRDPGVITSSQADKCSQIIEMSEGDTFTGNFCSTCLIIRPMRSKHCRYCDHCVRKFDHHCIWIGKCIGMKNHRLFMSYLLLLYFSSILMMMGIYSYYTNVCGEFSTLALISCELWVTYTFFLTLFLFFWLNVLVFMQVYGITHAMTANERLNAYRYKHFQTYSNSPFSRGCAQNICEFLFDDEDLEAAPQQQPIHRVV